MKSDSPRGSGFSTEEETVILHGKPRVEDGGTRRSILNNNRNTFNATATTKYPPVFRLKLRNYHHHRERAAAAALGFLLCLMLFLPPVAEGFPVRTNCFTCMDVDRCKNVTDIYTLDGHSLFARNLSQTLPACSDLPRQTGNDTCDVCDDESRILIYCPNHVTQMEVEDGKAMIPNITKGCERKQTSGHGRGRYGLIPVFVILGILILGLLIRRVCLKNSADGQGNGMPGAVGQQEDAWV